jgi:hypothetical protein
MSTWDRRGQEQGQRTRRSFLQLGSAAVAAWNVAPFAAAAADTDPQLQEAIAKLEYLTPLDRAFILDKGKANVAKLGPEKLREIGLVPDTWSLEVVPDPASNSVVESNDSDAELNNDPENPLKTRARFIHVPKCCSPACRPAVMICAAAPLTAMASRNPCHARCREPVSTPSTW